jgi:hypothetical protein
VVKEDFFKDLNGGKYLPAVNIRNKGIDAL